MLWALAVAAPLFGTIPPADWVPARWNWTDVKSPRPHLRHARQLPAAEIGRPRHSLPRRADRGIIVLAVIRPVATPPMPRARPSGRITRASCSKAISPRALPRRVKDVLADSKAVVIQLTSRSQMDLAGADPDPRHLPGRVARHPGAGKRRRQSGAVRTRPGSIPTPASSALCAPGAHAAVWLGNLPPAQHRDPRRALSAGIGRCGAVGRTLDPGARRRFRRAACGRGKPQPCATGSASRCSCRFFEAHPEWRAMQPYGKLAIVQDPAEGGAALRRHPGHDRRAAHARASRPAAKAEPRGALQRFARWR